MTAHILPHPFVKNGAEKLAILRGLHAPRGHWRFRELAIGRRGEIEILRMSSGIRLPLDQRDELDEAAADFFEEAIDFQRMLRVPGIDDGEGVELCSMFFQQIQTAHHAFESGALLFIHAVGVVQVCRSINADADKEAMLREKSAPFVIEQRAVGLDAV